MHRRACHWDTLHKVDHSSGPANVGPELPSGMTQPKDYLVVSLAGQRSEDREDRDHWEGKEAACCRTSRAQQMDRWTVVGRSWQYQPVVTFSGKSSCLFIIFSHCTMYLSVLHIPMLIVWLVMEICSPTSWGQLVEWLPSLSNLLLLCPARHTLDTQEITFLKDYQN